MSNNIIEVIKKRLEMLCERELIDSDECKVLRLLVDEIVQCKDCALRVPEHEEMTITGDRFIVPDTCKLIRGYIKQIEPEGFCAWGERKVVN